MYDAWILQNRYVSYLILHFSCVKSMSLPFPWCVPAASMPYLSIIGAYNRPPYIVIFLPMKFLVLLPFIMHLSSILFFFFSQKNNKKYVQFIEGHWFIITVIGIQHAFPQKRPQYTQFKKCKQNWQEDLQFLVFEEDWSNCKNWEGESCSLLLNARSPLSASLPSTDMLLGLKNISPDRDGIDGKKKGAFSGFFGGSIGLLRT